MKTSESDIKLRQLTVRIPKTLLQQSKQLADRRHISVNQLIRSLLEQVARDERERELRNAFDLLGQDQSQSDVEPYFAAQAETVRRGRGR